MSLFFVPTRPFLGRLLFSTSFNVSRNSTRNYSCSRALVQANLTARERRRAKDQARINIHKSLKIEIENRETPAVSAIVSIPNSIRARCSLTHRLSKTRMFLDEKDFNDIASFKQKMRTSLVRLYPELEERGLLGPQDSFDVKVGGGPIVDDLCILKSGVERCENAGSPIYVEVILHNAPPPKPLLSERVSIVRDKSNAVLADPNANLHMISFYKFLQVQDPERLSSVLSKVWSWMGVLGRVYIAKEGINAQLAVPAVTIDDFRDAMNGEWFERGQPVIPDEIVGLFLNFDRIVPRNEQPFEKLSVRPRHQVLADGFNKPLNWNDAGREIPSEEWHTMLTNKSEEAILLDCRNKYESDVGHFEGAQLLNTDSFRETWEELEKRLEHVDRTTPLRTYCTGGIRCVKVNAYLEQKMGFTDTGRLQGGIVKYAKTLREKGQLQDSKFKGVNHVFDGRMGEVITDDLLHRCINCGQLSNVQTDCANTRCPRSFQDRMFVQCADCARRLHGACSEECQSFVTEKIPDNPEEKHGLISSSDENWNYADSHSMPETEEMKEIRKATYEVFPDRAHMICGSLPAGLLRMLVQITGTKGVLEIGTFTGYSAIAMASALPSDGKIVTCEVDEDVGLFAKKYFDRSIHREKISLRLGKAVESLHELKNEGSQFRLAFVDAEKGGYETYKNILVETDLLPVGGIIVFDNVLFRGEVARLWREGTLEGEEDIIKARRLRNIVNIRKTASKLKIFNEVLYKDERFEQVMLPVRDGLTIARRIL